MRVVGAAEILVRWFPWFEWAPLVAFALMPLAIVVLGGFLVAHGVTMLPREVRSLGNLLPLMAELALLAQPVPAVALVLTLNAVTIMVFLSYAAVYQKIRHSIGP